uniref:ISXO2-like transposase domain-containing protein n=1 Tax=Amphimedon queenslandica TaxID=400682 RepID=A0A1X7U8M0_AMPQE
NVIYSDLLGAYNGLDRLLGQNYTHHTVNHSNHFVDPVIGAHTQSVESMRSQCKEMMRKM